MFSHLFNTYEAVTPPPRFNLDSEKELYQGPELEPWTTDLLPSFYKVTLPEKLSNEPTILEDSIDSKSTEVYDNQGQLSHKSNLLIDNIISTGRSLIGSKYTYGGKSLNTGFDCSGFISYIYRQNGINVPKDSKSIFSSGTEVSLNDIQPGDIICSKGSGPSGRHVQMVSRVDTKNNLIYVLEAKGSRYGITEGLLTKKKSDIISVRRLLNQNNNDPFLTNLDIKRPATQTFDNNKAFAKTLNNAYKKALLERGINQGYSLMLTALDASESGWGKNVKGNYNYGNITTTGNDWHVKTGSRKWKDFKSLEDYVNYKITLLSNNRYKFFLTFPVNSNIQYAMLMLANRGYDPSNSSYGSTVSKVFNTVSKYLK